LQGYLLSRPVVPAKIPALLAARHPAFTLPQATGDALHLVERAHA
jgi:hypothetical protein